MGAARVHEYKNGSPRELRALASGESSPETGRERTVGFPVFSRISGRLLSAARSDRMQPSTDMDGR